MKAGADAFEGNSFYLQPDVSKNTFHNYPVIQENGDVCTMNHQIFNNMTRRKVEQASHDDNGGDDLKNIIKDAKPKLMKMNSCKILSPK